MEIRLARQEDIPTITKLLKQIGRLHIEARPDIFREQEGKYSEEEQKALLTDPLKPVYVAVEDGRVLGYSFCVYKEIRNHHTMKDRTCLYIDDLCVDEECRGKGVGSALYAYMLQLAKERGCNNVELNVWAFNTPAIRFYEKCGMKVQRMIMESETLQKSL